MSRRRINNCSTVLPDLFLNSILVSKFVNLLMFDGKKLVAEKILYSSLGILQNLLKKNKIDLLELAINNVRPIIEVKSRRVGGTTYQIPVEVRPKRSNTLAIRWIIFFARKRKNKTMIIRLFNELKDAINSKGNAVRKRDEVHRMAESNKAFAHYRW